MEGFGEQGDEKMVIGSWTPATHACNPSYSGGRDQEDCGLKPARANSPQDPISKKKKNYKKGLVE
jgi:hypothetical protein